MGRFHSSSSSRAIELFGKDAVLGLGGIGEADTFVLAFGQTAPATISGFLEQLIVAPVAFAVLSYGGGLPAEITDDDVRAAGQLQAAETPLLPGHPSRPSSLAG